MIYDQFMNLANENRYRYSLNIGYITMKVCDEVELSNFLRSTNFKIFKIYTANYRLNATMRTRKYLSLEKGKLNL